MRWLWPRRFGFADAHRHADADDLRAVTRAINGGAIGLLDRRRWLDAVRRAYGIVESRAV